MLNNQIFDQTCFHQARRNSRLQRSQTAVIDHRYPSPLTSEDFDSSNSAHQISSTTVLSNNEQNKTRMPPSNSHAPQKLTRNYSISSNRDPISDDQEKMSQEMKRKLANDLLSTLTTLRIREWRKRSTGSTFNQSGSLKEMNTENVETEKKPLPQQKESSNIQSFFTVNN
uniref:Uncharacterized protein n=1 Tax=Panagrolaimus sp. PS1159 TaxID=55785 RepID=A0AC35GU05_9BILA